jgi:FlaA1/EpsC-like NDP-sugar epimerase
MKSNFFEKSLLCKKLFNSLSVIKAHKKQDFIPRTNLLDAGKNILIFGASVYGKKVHDTLKNRYTIVAFIDNSKNKYNEVINGVGVYPPSEIAKLEYDVIFIASQQVKEIYEQLVNNHGVDKEKITY